MVGREHHAKGRKHGVEARLGIGERFDVGDFELHLQPFAARTLGAAFEQAADIVGGRDDGAAPRGVETEADVNWRKGFLRQIGYKL